MTIRGADSEVTQGLTRRIHALLPGACPEDNTHLSDLSLPETINALWPSSHGWQIDHVEETERGAVLYCLSHPEHGFAATLITTTAPTPPNRTGEANQPGTVTGWDNLDASYRAQNIYFAAHVHAATRIDALQVFVDANAAGSYDRPTAALTAALVESAHFMDDSTAFMVTMGTFDLLLARMRAYLPDATPYTPLAPVPTTVPA